MRRTLIASALAIIGLALGCANGTRGGQSAASLKDAVEETLGAEGFHIQGVLTLEDTRIAAEGDYVSPDRLYMSASDGGTPTTTIMVGRNNYSSEPDDPETFSVWEMPCDVGVDTFIPALAVVRHAEDVQQSRGAFTFRADGNEGAPIEGQARVEGGYLVDLVLRYTLPRINESVEERWTFSDFGTTARIEPPPREQVLDESRFEGDPAIIPNTGEPPACP